MCVSVSTLKEDLVKYNYLYDSADSVIEYLNGHLSEGNISSGQAEYIYEWSSYILGFRQEPITFSAEGKMIKIQMDEKEISLKENKKQSVEKQEIESTKIVMNKK